MGDLPTPVPDTQPILYATTLSPASDTHPKPSDVIELHALNKKYKRPVCLGETILLAPVY